MKILGFLKNKKLDTEVASRRKISTIEQELLDRCRNGRRIDPIKNYSHIIGYRSVATGIKSMAIGYNNCASRTELIDKFEVSIAEGEENGSST